VLSLTVAYAFSRLCFSSSYPPLAAEIYSEVEQQEWFVDTGVVEAPKGWGVLVRHDPIRLEILETDIKNVVRQCFQINLGDYLAMHVADEFNEIVVEAHGLNV
jgi:hypothetical protein